MHIVQKRDLYGGWVDVLHAQQDSAAFDRYKQLEKREGKRNVRIIQR